MMLREMLLQNIFRILSFLTWQNFTKFLQIYFFGIFPSSDVVVYGKKLFLCHIYKKWNCNSLRVVIFQLYYESFCSGGRTVQLEYFCICSLYSAVLNHCWGRHVRSDSFGLRGSIRHCSWKDILGFKGSLRLHDWEGVLHLWEIEVTLAKRAHWDKGR